MIITMGLTLLSSIQFTMLLDKLKNDILSAIRWEYRVKKQ